MDFINPGTAKKTATVFRIADQVRKRTPHVRNHGRFCVPKPDVQRKCTWETTKKSQKKSKKILKLLVPVAFSVRSVSDTCYRTRQGRFRNGKEGDGDYSADGGCSDVLVGYKCNILPEAHDRPRTGRLPECHGRQSGPCDMELRSQ